MGSGMSEADAKRFAAAAARFAHYHGQDPRGESLAHAGRISHWVETLSPDAGQALRLAARAQHIGRWRIPRDSYPPDRSGYLRWRRDLQGFHAEEAADILADCGYPREMIDRVGALLRKRNLRSDAECQVLEDALCLTFVERQLAGFSARHGEAKLQRIIRKTWQKMSPAGREAALGLELDAAVRALLERSLSGPSAEAADV